MDDGSHDHGAARAPTEQLRPRGALYAVDLLRFAAAMLVVLFHFFAGFASPGHKLAVRFLDAGLLPETGKAMAGYGWIGVEIFFVISGYVIAISAHGSRALPFARRRVLRLWPAALLCATLTLAVLWPLDPRLVHLDEYWRSAVLWPWGEYIDGSYWTLAVEGVFYALVALSLLLGRGRDLIDWVAMGIGLASALYWITGANVPGISLRDEQLLLLTHGCYFALGILLHRWHGGQRGPWTIAMFILMAVPALLQIIVRNGSTAYGIGTAIDWKVAVSIFLLAFGVVALSPTIQPALERVLPRRPVLLLGLATYPLYLIHQTVGLVMIVTLVRWGMPYVAAALTALVCLTALALAIAAWAEPWLRALMSRALPFSPPSRGPAPDRRPSASPTGG